MSNLEKLAALGCGSEILNSVMERSNIHAAIYNAATFLKYYKGAVKSGIYTKEDAIQGFLSYYNAFKNVEHLANKYDSLCGEKYAKMKLQIEKFMN